jgi:DNA-binding MarR family transcriptional regulator
MTTLFVEQRDAKFTLLARHHLTPPHAMAMGLIGRGPIRMSELAEGMRCDASYATAVVDRLEGLGFAERRVSDTDRRVKQLVLTRKGRTLADRLMEGFRVAPSRLDRLTSAQRRTLAQLMAVVVPDDEVVADPLQTLPSRGQ